MEQMNISPDLKIEMDLRNKTESILFNTLKPIVFNDEHLFCCLFGPDLKYGIKGFGHTPEEAIEDWEISVRKRIAESFDNDEVAQYVISVLNSGNHYAAAS